MSETKINSSLSSKFKKTQVNSIKKLPDITGHTLGEFYADSRLDIVSGEADIYLCTGTGSLSGKKLLLKYYRRENAVKPDVLEKLKGVNSPFVAPVEGFGEYMGHQYMIRPYYEMSALSELLAEGTRFSEEELTTLIIPSIIEGLKVVHDAGILHKDLKPANLIPDASGEHIVIIDFGISSDTGKNTFVVTQTGMTPFYAAPEAMQGIFHKETDYYALGITVFELFTGFTPFQNPGLTPEEAARLASVSKIEFPANFPEDLKKLVLGLTYKDLSHRNEKDNPNRRWGYDEVRRWLKGEDVPVPGEIPSAPGFIAGDSRAAGASPSAASAVFGDPFQAYRFNGKTYTAEADLLRAMLEQSEAGLKDLGRGFLSHHYYAFSEKKGALCEYAEKKLAGKDPGNHWANTRILYALIYSLNPEVREICFNGQILNSVQELGRAFIDAGTKEALQNHGLRGQSYPLTSTVKEFVLSGIPEDYAVTILKNNAVKELFSKNAALWKNYEHTESDTELALILGYSLCSDRRISVGGKIYESPKAFRSEMAALVSKDRNAYMKLIETARADLDFLEKNLPDQESRKALSQVLDDAKFAVFGDNEYHFKNGQEFQNYIQKLVNEEKTYEIRSLLNRYKIPLKQVSKTVWGSDSLEELQKTVSGFIRVGEYFFTGEKSFCGFLTEIMEKGKKDPRFIDRFIRAHKTTMEQIAAEHPRLNEIFAKLYQVYNNTVILGEYTFSEVSDFKVFVNKIQNQGNTDPAYLKSFVTEHQISLTSLAEKKTLANIVTPLIDAASRIVELDEYVFPDAQNFSGFVMKLKAENREKPLRASDFAQEHKTSLETLKKADALASAVSELQNAENVLEKGETIMVNGTKYASETKRSYRYIEFGSYPQNNDSTKKPIKWLVLDVDDKEALLLSLYGLDCKQYHHENGVSWENSNLRKWLNYDFLKTAFSDKEQKRIKLAKIVTNRTDTEDTKDFDDEVVLEFFPECVRRVTRDRIFCLSERETQHYLNNDYERRCQPTALAKAHGAFSSDDGYCHWWLRSNNMDYMMSDEGGELCVHENISDENEVTVRPALRISSFDAIRTWDSQSARITDSYYDAEGTKVIVKKRQYITFNSPTSENNRKKEKTELNHPTSEKNVQKKGTLQKRLTRRFTRNLHLK